MKLNENSETKKSSRGWEWTEDERDAIKPLKRKLEKQYNSVKKMVSGLPKTIPEFAKDAEMYGKPYLESACIIHSSWFFITFGEIYNGTVLNDIH